LAVNLATIVKITLISKIGNGINIDRSLIPSKHRQDSPQCNWWRRRYSSERYRYSRNVFYKSYSKARLASCMLKVVLATAGQHLAVDI